MRVMRADIGHSGELHRMLVEYSRDLGKAIPSPDFWLVKFQEPTFYCLIAKHGKKPVGFVMGSLCPYFDDPEAIMDSFFVRRGFRKIKFIRELLDGARGFFNASNISKISYNRIKSKVRKINGK